MKIITEIQRCFVKSFTNEKDKLKYNEETALRNLVSIAKERIWLADPIYANRFNTDDFDEDITQDVVNKIGQSIEIVENYIEKKFLKFLKSFLSLKITNLK